MHARTWRYREITVAYQDPQGIPHQIRADGLLARCIQHEIDYNNGIFFVDPNRLHHDDRRTVRLALGELLRQQAILRGIQK
ncbi:MAG: peptide deformylase [Puniceicoccales bacterium]|nr:peptide deformylase [Puniceicoccales bacterium]